MSEVVLLNCVLNTFIFTEDNAMKTDHNTVSTECKYGCAKTPSSNKEIVSLKSVFLIVYHILNTIIINRSLLQRYILGIL